MEMVNDIKCKLPMLITFVNNKPVILQDTDIQLQIPCEDFLLYVNVMKTYVESCYHGKDFDLKTFDVLWPKVVEKIKIIVEECWQDTDDLSAVCKQILTLFDKCQKNIREVINDDLMFINRLIIKKMSKKFPKQPEKDKESIFIHLWDLTDRLLFVECAHVFAPISMSLLLLAKIAITKQCVIQQDATSSSELNVNWTASLIVNFLNNADSVFDSFIRRTVEPIDLNHIKIFIKRELDLARISPRVAREDVPNIDAVYNWMCSKYLNRKSNTSRQLRTRIIEEIAYRLEVNNRMAAACEMWMILESCFPKLLATNVRCISEIETYKYFTGKDVVNVLREIRLKFQKTNIRMIDHNNINEIFDVKVLECIITIMSTMLTSSSN